MLTIPHSRNALYQEIEKAEDIKASVTTADNTLTFEDGVISALMWAMGKTSSPCEDISTLICNE